MQIKKMEYTRKNGVSICNEIATINARMTIQNTTEQDNHAVKLSENQISQEQPFTRAKNRHKFDVLTSLNGLYSMVYNQITLF